jgi:hypothetical protein
MASPSAEVTSTHVFRQYWAGLPMTGSTSGLSAALAQAAAAETQYPEGRFKDRGIVICAGGARLFTCAYVTIALLRRTLGCTLPIEVWHLGPEEMGPPMRGLLEDLAAEPVDALEVARRHPVGRLGGWELKSYALLNSRFREVLLLDADNVPVRDPAFLFDRPEFQETGAMFWPDLVRLALGNPIWAISGLGPQDGPSFESGQMVLDKRRCWRALALAHWMNQRSEDFYDVLHGDKDTFLIAWSMLGQARHLVRHLPKTIQWTMCQRDPDGAVLFQHRNEVKWILHGENPPIEGFRWQDECLSLLRELAGLWDGRVFNPPARSPEARRREGDLARQRHFRFTRVSSDERLIELLPDHRIGAGAGEGQFTWHVGDGEGGLELILEGEGRRRCALRPFDDGIWRGRLAEDGGMPVEVAPTTPGEGAAGMGAADHGDGSPALALLDRVLEIYVRVPWDAEVARDFIGAVRTLAILDPAVADRLRAMLAGADAFAPRHSGLVGSALDALTGPAQRPERLGVAKGRNRLEQRFERVKAGYERLR